MSQDETTKEMLARYAAIEQAEAVGKEAKELKAAWYAAKAALVEAERIEGLTWSAWAAACKKGGE